MPVSIYPSNRTPDGNAANPAWAFASEPGMGVCRLAAGVFGFSAAGGPVIRNASATDFRIQTGVGTSLYLGTDTVDTVRVNSSYMIVPGATQTILVRTQSDSANGAIQLASHASVGGGIAFGTAASAESIWRHGSSTLRTGSAFRAGSFLDSNGLQILTVRQTGWTAKAYSGTDWVARKTFGAYALNGDVPYAHTVDVLNTLLTDLILHGIIGA